MSHEATKWAFGKTLLTPHQWRILMILADCHNPAQGCFPGQDYLQKNSNMSRRSVQNQLDALEEMGLISRVASRSETTQRWMRTEYTLHMDNHAQEMRTDPPSHAHLVPEPCASDDKSRAQEVRTNHVIEPVREPVSNTKKVNSTVQDGKYAFEGRIIRLTHKDYDRWRKAYRWIPNLDAELEALDTYYFQEKVTKWFVRASAALKKRDAEYASTAKTKATSGEAWRGSGLG